MSQKMPAINAGQLRRALRREGWVEMRQRGSHIRLERSGITITIADHGNAVTIPRGTLASILRDADLTLDDLRRLL